MNVRTKLAYVRSKLTDGRTKAFEHIMIACSHNTTTWVHSVCQLLYHFLQSLKIVGADFDVEHIALGVNEFVGGEGVDLQIALYGCLLLLGKIEVGDIGTSDVVFLDDILPRILRTVVGEIHILDVIL